MTESPAGKVESTEILPLFPSFVWKTQLKAPDTVRINAAFKSVLSELTTGHEALAPGGKWQTNQDLHTFAELAEFNDIVRASARGILEFQRVIYTDVTITGCWANVSAPGATHKAHTHPNNYLSGVYYVETPGGAEIITFDDPRPQANVICPRNSASVQENAGQIQVKVSEGMLVLFPAWLPHSVPENRSADRRVSVAINLMFTEFGEKMSQPKWVGNVTTARR